MPQHEDALHFQPEWCLVTFGSIGDAVITTDTEGRVTWLNSAAIEDITERRRAQEKLRASEDGYGTLIEQVQDFARVQAYLAHSLLLTIRGGSAPFVAFSIAPTVG